MTQICSHLLSYEWARCSSRFAIESHLASWPPAWSHKETRYNKRPPIYVCVITISSPSPRVSDSQDIRNPENFFANFPSVYVLHLSVPMMQIELVQLHFIACTHESMSIHCWKMHIKYEVNWNRKCTYRHEFVTLHMVNALRCSCCRRRCRQAFCGWN